MSTTRTRMRTRLVAVVAGALTAGGLVALAPAAHADSTVTSGTLKWGFKSSFRTYVGSQLGAVPPIGAAPVGERITVTAPATFDPASPDPATTPAEAARPYVFPATSGTVTSATDLVVPTSGAVTYRFPSHHFEITLTNVKVVVSGTTATIYADTKYVADEAFGESPAGTIEETQVALATAASPTVDVQAKTATVSAASSVLTEAGADAVPLYEAGTALDGFTLSTTQLDPPTVQVSQTTVNPNGSTVVTVNGSGFDPALSIGTRPPLSGLQAGAYVVFGKFNPAWKPSAGAASSTRTAASVANGGQRWALPAAAHATVGGANAGAVTLNANGTFTAKIRISKAQIDAAAAATPTNTQYGIYTYPGSGANAPSLETFTPITFSAPGTAVSLDAAGYAVTQGTAKTVTATVAATSGTPTGNVQLVSFTGDGTETVLDTKPLSGGSAALQIPASAPLGTAAVVARYVGDGVVDGADSSPSTYTVKVNSQVAFNQASYAPLAGATTAFTVTVTKPADVAAPTGNVVATYTPQGGSAIAIATVNLTAGMNGVATFTLPALTGGAQGVVSATYAGNGTYNAGAATDATYLVADKVATVELTGPFTGTVGDAVSVPVTVKGDGVTAPTGTVSLSLQGSDIVLDSDTLTDGAATLELPGTVAAGSGTVVVSYGGDSLYAAGTGTATYELSKTASSLSLTSGPSTARYGTSPTFVVDAAGLAGGIEVRRNGVLVTAVPISGAGTASWTVPATWSVGPHTLSFRYPGTAQQLEASTVRVLRITKAASRIGLAVVRKATARKAGAVSATVRSTTGGPLPVGKVVLRLKKGKVTRTVTRTLVNGRVVWRLPKVGAGRWTLRVAYQGSTAHTGISRVVTVKVAKR